MQCLDNGCPKRMTSSATMFLELQEPKETKLHLEIKIVERPLEFEKLVEIPLSVLRMFTGYMFINSICITILICLIKGTRLPLI